MKTILAAVDFSPLSRRVVAEALILARAVKGRIVILHAVKPPAIVTELAPLMGEALQFTAEVERVARDHLRRWQKRLAERGVTVETICQQGFPTGVILAHARKLKANCVVLGSHGHTAVYDLVVGSTASGVLKRAECPVVIVPATPATRKRRQSRRT